MSREGPLHSRDFQEVDPDAENHDFPSLRTTRRPENVAPGNADGMVQ